MAWIGTRRIALLVGLMTLAIVAPACASQQAEPTLAPLDPAVVQELPSNADVLGAYVGDVALPDVAAGGSPFTMEAADGEVLVVYFGFTSCPDICPTTLSDLGRALGDMGAEADRVDVAMVTIDPERDQDSTVEAYLSAFVDGGHPLRTADDAELRRATDAFGADYSLISTGDDVDVQHTAYLYAVDDDGRIAIVWPFGVEPDRIRSDLGDLLAAN